MNPQLIIYPLLSFGVAVLATYAVRQFATARGIVSVPTADRWNRKSIALMGGVAIYLTMVFNWVLVGHFAGLQSLVIATSTMLFLAGLLDDFANLKPYQKLIAQLVAVSLFAASGIVLPWTPYVWANTAITFVWLIGITNAVNLLDNMDGLAAGISAIAGLFLAKLFFEVGQTSEGLLMLCFSAAVGGFLVFNWNPATIFMGDCGSMLLGFFLGGMSLLYVAGGRFRSFVPVIAVPVLVLLIPIFDTAFVSILRKLSGRSISTGGRDHTSHRLVRLGIPEKQAVLLFYGLACLSGVIGVFITRLPLAQGLVLLACFIVGIAILAIYIANVKVYSDEETERAREQPVIGFLFNVSQKQPVFEVALDVVLITIAFQIATFYHHPAGAFFPAAMLVTIATKLCVFLIAGLYREIWRFISVNSALVIVRSVSIAAAVLVILSSMVAGFSFSMIVFDACVTFALLLCSRISFRALKGVLYGIRQHPDTEPALIFGAGDAGELLCRELLQNPNHPLRPAGFLDDDGLKLDRTIHGFEIYDGRKIQQAVEQSNAKHVILSTKYVDEERLQEIVADCQDADVDLLRMNLQIREIGAETRTTDPPNVASLESNPVAMPR